MSSVPRFAPSSLNWTPDTPTLSEAEAEIVIVFETVCPDVGEVMETVGAVVSATSLTVIVIVSESVPPFPSDTEKVTG